MKQISQENQRMGFAPSVPFVAGLGACMVVAELVKFSTGLTTELDTRYQFDALRGPAFGSMIPQERRRDCNCVVRAKKSQSGGKGVCSRQSVILRYARQNDEGKSLLPLAKNRETCLQPARPDSRPESRQRRLRGMHISTHEFTPP